MRVNHAFGIYIHWPFCEKKCPYCDFNSHVRSNIDHRKWLAAYVNELRYYADETSERTVSSVFFGGGTPSLMRAEIIKSIVSEIQNLWQCADNLEITAEANPSSSEIQLYKDFQQAGINRLSIGVQSLNQQSLLFLGRLHSADEARSAVKAAAKIFKRYSFDLNYALPDQTPEKWKDELGEALQIAGSHLSLYQLTIEPGTKFHKDRVLAANEDTGTKLYELTQKILNAAGMPAYEISNHSAPGEQSRHNLVYWQGQDYLGIGPGAHGRLTHDFKSEMMHNYREPEKWLALATTKKSGRQKRATLTSEQRRNEIILMGLRLSEGVSSDHFRSLTNTPLLSLMNQNRLKILLDEGFLVYSGGALKATSSGRQRLNAILAYLLV
jgi:oxygen-independent coproporphyrinogen-3 oxidase